MKYLEISDQVLNDIEGLADLVFPTEACDTIIWRSTVMVPSDHPNISFIIMLLPTTHWYDDDSGPYKFIRYA